MVSQIQLGNFFNSGGKTVLGGVGGSGLDTETLVKTLTEAKRLPAVNLEDKVKLNEKKTTALGEFQKLLSKVKDAANFLRNPPGVGNAADNVFKFTNTSVTSSTTVVGSTYLNVSSSPGAATQSYTINEISSLAKAKKQASEEFAIASADVSVVSDTPGASEFKSGSFTLNGQNITLAAGDTLNTVAAKFNAVSGSTGVAATIIKIADNRYQLSFVATKSGLDNDFDFNSGDVSDPTGVLTNITISTTDNAANAIFKINDVEVTRQSNSISDVISGLTFNLLQTTPAPAGSTTLTVAVKADDTIIKNGIVNFANAYNELKLFAAKQSELKDDGTFADDAVLSDNQMFRNSVATINSQLASIVSGISGSNPSRLADLGITFADLPESNDNPTVRNILNIDEGKLGAAIASNPDGVRKVFEFDFTTTNPNLRVFSRTNALGVSAFTLNINPVTSTYEATYNTGSGNVTIQLDKEDLPNSTGITLKGKAGTVLEGLVLVYTSTAAATMTVGMTQGIADKVFNVSDIVLRQNTGTLAVELESIKSSDTRLENEIKRIDEQVATYREQLLAKFGALEQAISRVNTLLQSLDAQSQARNNG